MKIFKVWKIVSDHSALSLLLTFAALFVTASVSAQKDQLSVAVESGQSKAELVVQTGNTDQVVSLVFSPDGRLIASECLDDTIKLWEAESGTFLRTFDVEGVQSIAFSPDGKTILSGSEDGILRAYNIATGTEQRNVKAHNQNITSVVFSPDGTQFLSGSSDGTVKVWNNSTGQVLHTLPIFGVKSLTYSPDGTFFASAGCSYDPGRDSCKKGEIKVWNAVSFQLRTSMTVSGNINSIVFSPDGRNIASGGCLANAEGKCSLDEESEVVLWDAETGNKIRTFVGPKGFSSSSVAFSRSGDRIISGYKSNVINLDTPTTNTFINQWRTETGEALDPVKIPRGEVENVTFSPNGTMVAISLFREIIICDAESWKEIRRLMGNTQNVYKYIALSPDGKQIATVLNYSLKLWDSERGNLITLSKRHSLIRSLAFSPDGQLIASGICDDIKSTLLCTKGGIELFDISTGKEKWCFFNHSDWVYSVAFSPDGKQLATGSDKEIKIWDVKTGVVIKTLSGHAGGVNSVSFSPDGKLLASISDEAIKLWAVETGMELAAFNGLEDRGLSIVFSRDGKRLAAGTIGTAILVWDIETRKLIKTLAKDDPARGRLLVDDFPYFFSQNSESFSFTRDLSFYVWASAGKIDLYERKGSLLASFFAFNQDDWVVMTPDGYFDGTPNGWKNLIWRMDNNTFNYASLEAFFKEFYRPGLLQDIFAGNKIEPPKQDLTKIDIRQPFVRILSVDGKAVDSSSLLPGEVSADKKSVRVKVEIADNVSQARAGITAKSSDANDVRLFRNGSLVKLWNNNAFALTEKDGCKQIPATKESPRKAVCEADVRITAGKNEFSAYAFNHDNVKSSDAIAEVKGADSLGRKGRLQILSIGVNEYRDARKNLKYAVPDAVDFGAELRKKQLDFNRYDTSEVVQLNDKEATKQNILYALERLTRGAVAQKPANLSPETEKKLSAIEKTEPEDVLVVYFAGHGTAAKDRFYLIPTDGFPLGIEDEQTRIEQLLKQSISDLELESVFRELDAGQILFVIDACNSGQALEAEEKRRGPMNSRGLAQLAFEKGMYILTAAQSFQAALEVARTPEGKKIEHGLLTYSLLEGLSVNLADKDNDRQVIEREWFNYAVENVPRMQLEEMKKRNAEIKEGDSQARSEIIFANNDNKKLPPEQRGLQTPRVFYRRESNANPFVINVLGK